MMLTAVDLDGTLLNNEKSLDEENLQAIQEAEAEGMTVAIATGRAFYDVFHILENTGLNPWVISMNGACIHTPDQERFYHQPMDKSTALPALEWLQQERYYFEISTQEAILTPSWGKDLLLEEKEQAVEMAIDEDLLERILSAQFSQKGRRWIDGFDAAAPEDIHIYNILAMSIHPDKVQHGWNQFKERQDLTLVSSAPFNFELEHRAASKGNALEQLAAHLGVPMQQTAAIGDSLNDLSMLQIAGTSFAMANANPQVKAAAARETKSNTEHGVAHALRSLFRSSV
ncbi:Cof-type HAD-IIB family hydrolase [Alkalicoccus chagannorensis]|uniref:Cof-type HAD-IIB family hydrolase n=2 Tax=Alkalicoccus chagannorensis TaxID=427072 RepID=UPI00047A4CE7